MLRRKTVIAFISVFTAFLIISCGGGGGGEIAGEGGPDVSPDNISEAITGTASLTATRQEQRPHPERLLLNLKLLLQQKGRLIQELILQQLQPAAKPTTPEWIQIIVSQTQQTTQQFIRML